MPTKVIKKKKVEEVEEEKCEFCGGEGIIWEDEDDGEGHTAYRVSSRKCICQSNFNEDDQDQDD